MKDRVCPPIPCWALPGTPASWTQGPHPNMVLGSTKPAVWWVSKSNQEPQKHGLMMAKEPEKPWLTMDWHVLVSVEPQKADLWIVYRLQIIFPPNVKYPRETAWFRIGFILSFFLSAQKTISQTHFQLSACIYAWPCIYIYISLHITINLHMQCAHNQHTSTYVNCFCTTWPEQSPLWWDCVNIPLGQVSTGVVGTRKSS